MTKTKKTESEKKTEAESAVREISKLAGRGAAEVWTIFVRKSIVLGLSIVLVAAALIFAGVWMTLQLPVNPIGAGLFGVALLLLFVAVNYLGNPMYFAMNDVTATIKKIAQKDKDGWKFN